VGQGSADRYYEEAREGQIISFKAADLSPACAHRCWTAAMEHPSGERRPEPVC
jgi:hypothetical protein